MPNSNTATQFDPEVERSADLYRATEGWVAPGGPVERDPRPPALTRPAVSTPGPNEPGRITQPESTENVAKVRASRLPPIPGYVVERFIGRGGMGVVYRATHTATGRLVALKLINPSGNDDITRERFVREVHALAAIKHPNIVPVYDAGEWHDFPYCTMEFVPGGTLNEHLERVRTDLRAAVRLMVKVARAVEALHAKDILHRDLKPLNILLGPDDEPMVADFGLAKWIGDDSDLTHTGHPIGTRQYMSPEQTLGKKKDYNAGCDVWALGVTLYELFTGQRPFVDDGITDVYHCIRTAEPRPVTALSPDVPAELQAIVSKCLAKKPEDRYSTAAALANDLECWLDGKPISVPVAIAPPQPSRSKHPRRDRVVLMSCSAMALVAFATLFSDPAKPEKPPKTIAERVAGGEKVKLTNEKGLPLEALTHEPGHELQVGTIDGYHTFANSVVGTASLSQESLDFPHRVEADVAVIFQDTPPTRGGVYVGRRVWGGLPFKHESLVWAGVQPEIENRTNENKPIRMGAKPDDNKPMNWKLRNSIELYWWQRNENGSPRPHNDNLVDWDRNGKRETVRFARVVIDVRPDAVRASVDGMPLRPLQDTDAVSQLNRCANFQKQQNLGFPGYNFAPPPFGSGIGIFCMSGQCVVKDLTVSKLNP
ncbi:protein kinase [Gemmata sp. G18]|uniref:Protein kinase n=1 Tax=Gemmata palustris TaxID=2822762 RepID=A0ABS5BMP3_9BACT|nr:serine/threonine-protein kinase [Gemmata palustris]MBP3954982.1 protein kinase [Gemmata palustris]